LATHTSALKRHRQSIKRRERNRTNKTKIKNSIRAVREAVDAKSPAEAQAALRAAIPVIAAAASKGTIHRKNASRKVSRLAKRVNAFAAGTEQPA